MSLLAIFRNVDDLCIAFEQYLERQSVGPVKGKRGPKPDLSLSEIMTIIIHFHQSNYRHFKAYYMKHLMVHL